jgi:hypothetical protein
LTHASVPLGSSAAPILHVKMTVPLWLSGEWFFRKMAA